MSRQIMVIDDDEAIKKSFSLALEDTEYLVDAVESGEEAIKKAVAGKYDLVFLDLKMSGLDGVSTLRQLRRIDPDVPIYIVTAFHAEFLGQLSGVAKDGLRFEVVEKPIAADQIVSLVEGALGKRAPHTPLPDGVCEFKLYVAGDSENSSRAVSDFKMLLKNNFSRKYSLDIIDVLKNPHLAEMDGIFATPMVVRTRPAPVTRIVGSLGEPEKVMAILCSDETN
jgi:CheY-like chemotaxis protein